MTNKTDERFEQNSTSSQNPVTPANPQSAEEQPNDLVNCPKCGHKMLATVKKCPNCGYRKKSELNLYAMYAIANYVLTFGIIALVALLVLYFLLK